MPTAGYTTPGSFIVHVTCRAEVVGGGFVTILRRKLSSTRCEATSEERCEPAAISQRFAEEDSLIPHCAPTAAIVGRWGTARRILGCF